MVTRAAGYAPAFVARWVAPARGYQLRYLARRALRMGQTGRALQLLGQALRSHPAMLRDEPARTLVTLAAALVQAVAPAPAYRWAEAWGLRLAGRRARAA
jgi:hypothetical protein